MVKASGKEPRGHDSNPNPYRVFVVGKQVEEGVLAVYRFEIKVELNIAISAKII